MTPSSPSSKLRMGLNDLINGYGYTPQQLAVILDVDQSSIRQWASGMHCPKTHAKTSFLLDRVESILADLRREEEEKAVEVMVPETREFLGTFIAADGKVKRIYAEQLQ